jgi:hypothetical protein
VTLPPDGSTVSVTVEAGGQTMPSSATYSFPLGRLELAGPLSWRGVQDDGEDPPPGGSEWAQGGERSIDVTVPGANSALVFTTTSPQLHVFAAFENSGNAESPPPADNPNGVESPAQKAWTVGTGSTYATELLWCKPVLGAVAQVNPGLTCTDWEGEPGEWTDVGFHTVHLTKAGGENTIVGADMAFSVGAALNAQQLAGTFELVTSEFETDPSTCGGSACGAGPTSLPAHAQPCNETSTHPSGSFTNPNAEYVGANPGLLDRAACFTSNPFNIVVEPAALVQLSAIPTRSCISRPATPARPRRRWAPTSASTSPSTTATRNRTRPRRSRRARPASA